MRLLRPPVSRWRMLTGAPTSASATARASDSVESVAFMEDVFLDLSPGRADGIGGRTAAGLTIREQDAAHLRRKLRVGENLLKVVDEMGALECGDARQLARARVLEINIAGR